MKIFRRPSSQFASLDEESSDFDEPHPYSSATTTGTLRDGGMDTSSIFRSRWTASMPCLGDMSPTDTAAKSLLSNEENRQPEQSLMEDDKLTFSLVEEVRDEADGLVIDGETPAGWIRVRRRMGNSVRNVKRALKSIKARRNSSDEEDTKHYPISSDDGENIADILGDDHDDDDSIISFETEEFVRQLAMDDGAARRGAESRRKRTMRIVRDSLIKKTVGNGAKKPNVQPEPREANPAQVSGSLTTLSADMITGDPYSFDY